MIRTARRSLLSLAAILALATATTHAAAPQPFTTGSHARILAAHREQPMILAFWSLSCSHCLEELALLADLQRHHPRMRLVLVSTDTPQEAGAIEALLQQHGLERAPSWVFADDLPERLRFEIDRRWRGELPRTYLHGANGSVEAITGKLTAARLEDWLRAQATR